MGRILNQISLASLLCLTTLPETGFAADPISPRGHRREEGIKC